MTEYERKMLKLTMIGVIASLIMNFVIMCNGLLNSASIIMGN